MKANELMIGDYARINRDGLCIKKGSVVVIRGIDADNKLEDKGLVGVARCHPLDKEQFDGGIWCDYLDSIPLTAEILEKNGWVSKRDGSGDFIYMRENTQGYGSNDMIVTKNIVGNFQMTHGSFNGISVYYVHELQHALRLCGIEKEIEL